MKTVKSILILAILLINGFAFSQSGWYSVIPPESGLSINFIRFPSENTGYAIGCYLPYNASALLKTTNAGQNWEKTVFDTIRFENIFFIDNNTGFTTGFHSQNKYIYKTTNGGKVWNQCSCAAVPEFSYFFMIKFCDYNTGFITTRNGGLLKTTNGGLYWDFKSGFVWHEPRSLECLDSNTWIVMDEYTSIFKTTNCGNNWFTIDLSNIGFNSTSMFFINSTTGYSTNYTGKIFKTTNSGENWLKICNNIPLNVDGNITFTNENTGFVCGDGANGCVFKTTNGGYNWIPSLVNPLAFCYSVNFINNYTGYAGGRNGNIFKTTNGGSVFIHNISGEVPEKFSLSQNYPNPFNQSTIFNLQCSRLGGSSTGLVKVIVYDASGREVQTLVNETLAPGTYQVRFDGSGLASGLYYYSMSIDGKQTAVKKMVMVK